MAQRPPSLKTRTAGPDPEKLFRFRLDGVEYTVDRSDISPRMERELFQQSGVTPQAAFTALTQGATFGIAALVYLARRQAGERVAYQQIEDALWKASQDAAESGEPIDLEVLEVTAEAAADAGPPQPGVSSGG